MESIWFDSMSLTTLIYFVKMFNLIYFYLMIGSVEITMIQLYQYRIIMILYL